MIEARPIYRCRRCSETRHGKIMELSDRSDEDLLVDLIDMAEPMSAPHKCASKAFGAWEYVGFDKL